MKICSFFGHRDVFAGLSDELKETIEEIIALYGIDTFYVGDRGDFDRQATSSVAVIKNAHPGANLTLVLPYFTNKLNDYRELYQLTYDEILIPSILADVHPKAAITKRNRWMVDQSDVIICYLNRDYGGAYETVKYAKRQNKIIINLGKLNIDDI